MMANIRPAPIRRRRSKRAGRGRDRKTHVTAGRVGPGRRSDRGHPIFFRQIVRRGRPERSVVRKGRGLCARICARHGFRPVRARLPASRIIAGDYSVCAARSRAQRRRQESRCGRAKNLNILRIGCESAQHSAKLSSVSEPLQAFFNRFFNNVGFRVDSGRPLGRDECRFPVQPPRENIIISRYYTGFAPIAALPRRIGLRFTPPHDRRSRRGPRPPFPGRNRGNGKRASRAWRHMAVCAAKPNESRRSEAAALESLGLGGFISLPIDPNPLGNDARHFLDHLATE